MHGSFMTRAQADNDSLEALIRRLIPSDESIGVDELAIGDHVRRCLPGVDHLLGRIDFLALSPVEQDAWLLRLEREGDPTFAALVSLVHELYYSNPASWHSIGYTSHIPGRP
jgi:hypothetical protein